METCELFETYVQNKRWMFSDITIRVFISLHRFLVKTLENIILCLQKRKIIMLLHTVLDIASSKGGIMAHMYKILHVFKVRV